jgi:hypothetical protein
MSFTDKAKVIAQIIEESPAMPSEPRHKKWLEQLTILELKERLAQIMCEGPVTPSASVKREGKYVTA